MKVQYKYVFVGILLVLMAVAGCATSSLDMAKKQYELAQIAEYPMPYYTAAIEELDAVIARDPNYSQAYAIKGLIYRNLEEFDKATENLELAKLGSYGAKQEWVPIVVNLTYGDIFHARAANAIRSGDWVRAQSYQETALEFFNNVINSSFANFGLRTDADEYGLTMQELYVSAQSRWAAGKFQMATVVSKTEGNERRDELLREGTSRLSSVVEAFPESTPLRYYLAEGYRKQALTVRKTDPAEGDRLQTQAVSQLRACAELGLPTELRNPAAQLFNVLSKGAEPETEQKILGTIAAQ
jgi:tetratricopeptide (TPR) repeat protein